MVAGVPWCLYSMRILHEMGFAHRFPYPVVPLAALGAARGVTFLLTRPEVVRRAGVPALRSIVWATVIAAAVGGWPKASRLAGSLHAAEQPDRYAEAFVRFGSAVGDLGLGEEILLISGQAGAIPYCSRARHIDLAGLTSAEFSPRVAEDERFRRLTKLAGDVEVSMLPPGSAGATSLEDDPVARSDYMATWVLRQEAQVRRLGHFTPLKRSWGSIVYAEMQRLRSSATLVGELNLPQPGWRAFIYVGNDSRYRDRLMTQLSARVDIPAARVR
jgi:hypothetical protein